MDQVAVVDVGAGGYNDYDDDGGDDGDDDDDDDDDEDDGDDGDDDDDGDDGDDGGCFVGLLGPFDRTRPDQSSGATDSAFFTPCRSTRLKLNTCTSG